MTKKPFQTTLTLMLLLASSCAEGQTSDVKSSIQTSTVEQSDESASDVLSIANSPEYAPIFERLTILIKQEISEEEQFKYLGNDERKGYLQQIRENHAPRRSKFKTILSLNNGEGGDLIRSLPEEFTDIHDTLENIGSKIKLETVSGVTEDLNVNNE